MKKSYLVMAAAATLFAACSSNDLVEEKKSPQTTQQTDELAVGFDAYTSRGTTRAGLSGLMNDTQLQLGEAAGGGFGVFGYYTDGERYAGNTKPNFFYNQGVFYSGGSWSYTPIKYWPNEFGNDAISDQIDRVSLFAYAPYVKVDPTSGYVEGDNTKNITALTRNNATGDPHVKYTATMDPTNTVDLCYGVAKENFTSSNSTSFPNNIEVNKPFIDVTKPALGGKIKFDFKHALAKLNVQIDAAVNNVTPDAVNNPVDGKTRIWVRSVTFEGITMKGALNLNSIGGSPEWYQIDASGDNKISTGSVTVYDGLKDGREPIGTAATELPASLNPAIIQSAKYNTSTGDLNTTDPNVVGVTATAQNLFKNSGVGSYESEPVYVIPTGEQMKVTIVYDVETYDKNLAYYLSDGTTQGSTIQNTITKTVDNFTALQAGKQYVLKLHLGMRSVDFEATVTDWDATVNNADTDLPRNNPSFAAAASSSTVLGTITIGAGEKTANFDVRGLDASEAVTATPASLVTSATVDGNAADASGLAKITANFAAVNGTVANVEGTVAVEGGTSHTGGTIKVVQNAKPFILATPTITAGTPTVTLDDATGSGTVIDEQWAAAVVTVKKKASDATTYVTLTKESGTGNKFTYAGGTGVGTITLGDNPAAGDKYIITVQVGNAPEVTSAEITVPAP